MDIKENKLLRIWCLILSHVIFGSNCSGNDRDVSRHHKYITYDVALRLPYVAISYRSNGGVTNLRQSYRYSAFAASRSSSVGAVLLYCITAAVPLWVSRTWSHIHTSTLSSTLCMMNVVPSHSPLDQSPWDLSLQQCHTPCSYICMYPESVQSFVLPPNFARFTSCDRQEARRGLLCVELPGSRYQRDAYSTSNT